VVIQPSFVNNFRRVADENAPVIVLNHGVRTPRDGLMHVDPSACFWLATFAQTIYQLSARYVRFKCMLGGDVNHIDVVTPKLPEIVHLSSPQRLMQSLFVVGRCCLTPIHGPALKWSAPARIQIQPAIDP
jgi:hypothetical protein